MHKTVCKAASCFHSNQCCSPVSMVELSLGIEWFYRVFKTVFLGVCWLTVITFPCICHKHTRMLKNSAEVVRLLWLVGHWSELTDNHLLDSVIFQLSWSHKPFSRLQHHSYSMSSLVKSFQKCQDTMKNVRSKIKTAWGEHRPNKSESAVR